VEALVQAQQTGSKGNLLANSIQAVIGPLGALVAVNNLAEISGGRDISTPAASAQDLARLRERMLAALKQDAMKAIERKTPAGSRLFRETIEMVKILDEKLTPAAGLPADLVRLSMRIEFRAWTTAEADLAAISQTLLNANLAAGKTAIAGTMQVKDAGSIEIAAGQIRWKIKASQQVRAGWTEQAVITAVAGKRIENGQMALAQMLNLMNPPIITVSPGWWPVVPLLPGRIEVVVQ
jgi:hypothetical protein